MGLKKTIFMASMSAAALFARAEKNQEKMGDTQSKDMYEYVQIGSEKEALPEFTKKFQSLDFDGRMELQETMAQQRGMDFHGTLYTMGLSASSIRRCQEIADYGFELNSINPQKKSLAAVARKSGFNRLADLMEFHENKDNEGKFFLNNQDAKYRSALIAEEDVFKKGGIFSKYDPNSRVEFNRMMASEFDHHAQKNVDKLFNAFSDGYHTILEEKVHQKLKASRVVMNSKKQYQN